MTSRRRFAAFIAAIPLIIVGSRITLPGVNAAALTAYMRGASGGLLRLYEMVFQGGLNRGAVLGLGIMPYLSARLYLWLWRRAMKGPPVGKRTTRLLTAALSVVQSIGVATFLQKIPGVVASPGPGFVASTVLTLTAGSLVAMWFGEQLSQPDLEEDGLLDELSLSESIPRQLGIPAERMPQRATGQAEKQPRS